MPTAAPPGSRRAKPPRLAAAERYARVRELLGEPFYDDGSGRCVYVGDSVELAKRIDPRDVDLLLADPPYGIKWDTDYTRFERRGKSGRGKNYPPIAGDGKPFDPSPWLAFRRVVLWGMQYFADRLPRGSTLVWLKKENDQFGTILSDAELAWEKGGYGTWAYRHVWSGRRRGGEPQEFLHPTQKPVGLMEWVIRRNDKRDRPCDLVLDPYAGSGPTLLAARRLGRFAIGIELSRDYAETIAARLQAEPATAVA